MNRWRNLLIIFSVLFLVIGIVAPSLAGPIQVLGIDTTSAWDYSIIESGNITGVNFQEVSISDFATVNLYDYDVLFVSETFLNGSVSSAATDTLNALAARESDIATWLGAGHGIVALSEPIGSNPYYWLPDEVQPTVYNSSGDDTVWIRDSTHPVMENLTSTGLSYWYTSSHGLANDAGLDVLVRRENNDVSAPITLAGNYGLGKVVITLQDPDYHYYYGNQKPDQVTFVQNAIEWTSTPVPEPATMLLLGSGLLGLAGFRRKWATKGRS